MAQAATPAHHAMRERLGSKEPVRAGGGEVTADIECVVGAA